MTPVSIEPAPTEEEAAAIVAVLELLREEPKVAVAASKWKMAGRVYDDDDS